MQQLRSPIQGLSSLVPRHSSLEQRLKIHTTQLLQVYEVVQAKDTPTTGNAITTRVKKLDFPPFVKDLFIGKFNKSVLNYAEVLNYERHRQLEEKVNQISTYLDSRAESLSQTEIKREIPPEVLHWCKTEGFHGLTLSRELGGQDLMATEVARVLEELGREISLSEFFSFHQLLCYQALVEYGTSDQQSKYLPGLCSGEYIAGFCLHEESAGTDPKSIETTAKYDVDTDTYVLEGKKKWVANADSAKLFILLAKTSTKNYMGYEEETFSIFLVDNIDGEISVGEPYPTTAYSGLRFSDVSFKCRVSKSNVLGEMGSGIQMIQAIQHVGKHLVAAPVVTNLKQLLNQTVEHCNTRKQFGLPLSKFSLVQQQLARMASKLYCLESMLYMTTGLMDMSECPDVELEGIIVKQYAAESSDFIVKTCLALLGRQALLETSAFQKYLQQNQFLQGWQGSASVLKCYIGISGAMNMLETMGPAVMNPLHPLMHPIDYSRWIRHASHHKKDIAKLSHKLEDNVHPRMVSSARRLEWVVEKIPFLTTNLIHTYGVELNIPETDLVKLADLVIETYAMTCALSRSNRSYIVGNLHAEHEVNLAIPYVADARVRCKHIFLELLNWHDNKSMKYDRSDRFWIQNGFHIAEKRCYPYAHPLQRRRVYDSP